MTEFRIVALGFSLIQLINICIGMPSSVNEELTENNARIISCTSLKRTWEEDGSCGKCMEWYTSDNIKGNDQCHPVANITVPMNEHNAFIPNGSTVNLKCEFDTNVNCSWKRSDSNIDMDQHDRYIGPDNGENTKDCSLQILNFNGFDVGHWICRSKATSFSNGRLGTQVSLSNEVIVTVRNNTTAYVQQGESVVLKCYFDEPVNCSWYRHNDSVDISERYGYIATNSSGYQTRDCSIKIERLQPQDMVTWKCQTKATSSSNATFSTIIRLRKKQTPNPRIFLFKQKGQQDNIICTLENRTSSMSLQWQLDDKEIPAFIKILENPDNGLYDLKISLTFTEAGFKNANLLKCVAMNAQGEWNDEIKVIDVKLFMTEQQQGNFAVIIVLGVLFGVVTAVALVLVVIIYKRSKKGL